MRTNRIIAYTALTLALAEVALVLLSWLLSATMTPGVRSLLSSEGLRWFFGSFVTTMQKPLLVWLLLLSMAYGVMTQSGLLNIFVPKSNTVFKQQIYRFTFVILLLYIGVILLLTVIPHAVLLSATGSLWPSPFSRALVPIVAFGFILISIMHGVLSRTFTSVQQVCEGLTWGIAQGAPLLLLYVLAVQLFDSLRFVFS